MFRTQFWLLYFVLLTMAAAQPQATLAPLRSHESFTITENTETSNDPSITLRTPGSHSDKLASVAEAATHSVDTCANWPCRNGGRCQPSDFPNALPSCACLPAFTGIHCDNSAFIALQLHGSSGSHVARGSDIPLIVGIVMVAVVVLIVIGATLLLYCGICRKKKSSQATKSQSAMSQSNKTMRSRQSSIVRNELNNRHGTCSARKSSPQMAFVQLPSPSTQHGLVVSDESKALSTASREGEFGKHASSCAAAKVVLCSTSIASRPSTQMIIQCETPTTHVSGVGSNDQQPHVMTSVGKSKANLLLAAPHREVIDYVQPVLDELGTIQMPLDGLGGSNVYEVPVRTKQELRVHASKSAGNLLFPIDEQTHQPSASPSTAASIALSCRSSSACSRIESGASVVAFSGRERFLRGKKGEYEVLCYETPEGRVALFKKGNVKQLQSLIAAFPKKLTLKDDDNQGTMVSASHTTAATSHDLSSIPMATQSMEISANSPSNSSATVHTGKEPHTPRVAPRRATTQTISKWRLGDVKIQQTVSMGHSYPDEHGQQPPTPTVCSVDFRSPSNEYLYGLSTEYDTSLRN